MKYSYCLRHHFAFNEKTQTLHIYAGMENRKQTMGADEVVIKQQDAFKKFREASSICIKLHGDAESPFSEQAGENPYMSMRLNDVPEALHGKLLNFSKENNVSISQAVQDIVSGRLAEGTTIYIDKALDFTQKGKSVKVYDIPDELYSSIRRGARRKRIPMRIFVLNILDSYFQEKEKSRER